MIELIVVCIFSFLFCFVWGGICIKSQAGVFKGLCMALGVPLMVALMIGFFVYVIHCFHVVLN